MTEDGCMLCDMRDLAHCAVVCKRWYLAAQSILYSHVRIDAVHYCELEVQLAARRKRRSFFDRNGDPIDAPQARLELFMRSVRHAHELGNMVLSLRMPYMTREANKASIARTISACPDMRGMAYRHGSEGSFSQLPGSRLWMNLETLKLSRLQIEPNILCFGLGAFPRLLELTLEDLAWLDDSAFRHSQSLPPFPAVQ
ncbi:hypothetical protein CNMCM8927_000872 [Aspergillus lentulus]|uniref:F-box domain-containing protein n=1 Tax=Aspergillus lentulus TaxID=293939 RepID=A0AAN6BMJ5_ASPLE|nr:hypothetical protein CNMCM8927_000872 [Aspergillus lentulus]